MGGMVDEEKKGEGGLAEYNTFAAPKSVNLLGYILNSHRRTRIKNSRLRVQLKIRSDCQRLCGLKSQKGGVGIFGGGVGV